MNTANPITDELKAMKPLFSHSLQYKTFNRLMALCWVSGFTIPNTDLTVVVFSQPHRDSTNKLYVGPSITNGIEDAVDEVLASHKLDPFKIIAIEHYPEGTHDGPASFAIVQHSENGVNPRWRHMTTVKQLNKLDVWAL